MLKNHKNPGLLHARLLEWRGVQSSLQAQRVEPGGRHRAPDTTSSVNGFVSGRQPLLSLTDIENSVIKAIFAARSCGRETLNACLWPRDRAKRDIIKQTNYRS